MKNVLALCFSCWLALPVSAQAPRADKPLGTKRAKAGPKPPAVTLTISGKITGKTVAEDSLFFVTGAIDKKYYAAPIPPARITANAFQLKAAVSYPQLWRILLKSDRGMRVYRQGEYFIDASTSTMTADYLAQECNQVDGPTATEYRTKFIPFFHAAGAAYDCHQLGFDELAWDNATRFDSTLYRYVQANPNSYVALWSLIERFSKFGHSQLRERTLAGFPRNVKDSRPWQVLHADMRDVLIKQGAAFPLFSVKGIAQPEQPLRLPKAQYTLVDFWFSRCRPCIESFPALKQLYAAYQPKGFEIVSISTDQTQYVPLWQKRIKEYELPWAQYLDENAVAATKSAVYSFPTTLLLDRNGKVLLRDITPEELEKFLAAKLGK
ncbi:hypothetical protein BEN47_10475 [Hymenobacter lapidarius]|uniref:Thioredoxin domain-containing protein n=1 Tax=Hymenobacter lapidarius TaxID=1908237 RepID=A0A1G1T9B2_9BACT|nr:TlpA disulfide reductase family protein [Hymenobacter lapidarius]OGX87459.1 hypothetical protein BEN47_10475 [Hymenobacter lapidarius]